MKDDLLEISDGKLYSNNDMVKVGCHDCEGCSSCCRDMGQSIWLDPYDVFSLTHGLGKCCEELLKCEVELHVEDGLILPNLRMNGDVEPACGFLNQEGRCSIHAFRPGLCRLFPLGRDYDSNTLRYFLLKDACPAANKSKVKVNKWLSISRIKDYERFLVEWHTLTKKLRGYFMEHAEDEAVNKAINMKFLQEFYMTAYEGEDFYIEFDVRMRVFVEFLQSLGI